MPHNIFLCWRANYGLSWNVVMLSRCALSINHARALNIDQQNQLFYHSKRIKIYAKLSLRNKNFNGYFPSRFLPAVLHDSLLIGISIAPSWKASKSRFHGWAVRTNYLLNLPTFNTTAFEDDTSVYIYRKVLWFGIFSFEHRPAWLCWSKKGMIQVH